MRRGASLSPLHGRAGRACGRRTTARVRQRPAAPAPAPNGIDDGTTLTLWTRAPLEKQAKLLVEAYNASHKNQVDAHGRPQRRLRREGRRGGRRRRPARPVRGRHRLRAQLGQAGPVPGPHRQHRRAAVQGLDQQGPPDRRHSRARSTSCRSSSTCRCMFWNKDLFKQAGLDPDKGPATLAGVRRATPRPSRRCKKPGVYGTATGAQLRRLPGLHLVPDIWASGDQVLNPDGTKSLLDGTDAKRSTHLARPVGLGRRAAVVQGRDRAHLDRRLPAGKIGLMPYPATLLSSHDGFDVGVGGHPGRQRRRLHLRRRRRHRRLQGLEEGCPGLELPRLDDVRSRPRSTCWPRTTTSVSRGRPGEQPVLARRTRGW